MQAGDELRVRLDILNRCERAGSDGGRECVAEQLRPGALGEIVGECGRAGGESAGRAAQRFSQRRGDHVDLAQHVVMLGGAAARLPENAGRVGVIDGEHRVVLPGQRDEIGQLRDIALHREDAVGEDQLPSRLAGGAQLLFEVGHVGVLVDRGLALGDRFGEANRVDDRRVVQLVGDDDVWLAEDGGAEPFVGVPAADVGQRRLAADETRQRVLELAMHGERPANEAHRRGAGAPALERVPARLHDVGDGTQAEVVVGGEDDDFAASFHPHARPLRGVEVIEPLVDALLLELRELVLQLRDEAHAISRMTLPASPERMAARASSILASGNLCVMTGRGSNCPLVRKRRICCQVWYILRPMTPYTVIPLKMISLAKSTGTSPSGIPSSCTRPPRRTAANAWCSADGTPDISHTTSAPSPPVSARTVFTTSSLAALIVTCAPILAARARRLGFTSDAITFVAPAARAMPTAKQPIGPHPTMKTKLPGISAVSTAWNALPIGSMTAPTVVGMPFKGSTLVAGIAMYSAN